MINVDSTLCPQIIKKLNYSIEATKYCKSTWTGADECEARDIDGGQWVVVMAKKTISCRRWELTCIPCSHGCQALFTMNQKLEEKNHSYYSKAIYMKTYVNILKPIKGSLYWPHTGFPDILPPKARRMPGRPKRHRRREGNKSTCMTSKEACEERHKQAAEAKKKHKQKQPRHKLQKKKEEGIK
ncbi:uncharacterized protein LOC141660587 [Apium graveolens]|uniref:uncharacterized protein LOC141660587 n=1 Tax=Apium graveolens TaxID=4045 RepID=UPI003D795C69